MGDAGSVALRNKPLIDLSKVEGGLDRVTDLLALVNALVAWLITTFIGNPEVGDVLASIFKTETRAARSNSKVDNDVVVCSTKVIFDHLEDSFKCRITVRNRHGKDLTVD